MNETLIMTAVLLAGVLLGAFFFGGLWWTVRRGVTAKHSRALVCRQLSSFRTGAALAGFYLGGAGRLEKITGLPVGICHRPPRCIALDPHKTGESPCTLVPTI